MKKSILIILILLLTLLAFSPAYAIQDLDDCNWYCEGEEGRHACYCLGDKEYKEVLLMDGVLIEQNCLIEYINNQRQGNPTISTSDCIKMRIKEYLDEK